MATQTINPEVVNDIPKAARAVTSAPSGAVAWDGAATIKSPFFWLVIGAVAVIAYYEIVRSRERKANKPRPF